MSLEVLGTVTDDRAVSLGFWTEVKDKAVVLYASLASHRGQLPVRNAKVCFYTNFCMILNKLLSAITSLYTSVIFRHE